MSYLIAWRRRLSSPAAASASDQGTVSYPLNPAALGLSHGHHVLTLQGMLITTTASFRS
jgi:hypothetical protein